MRVAPNADAQARWQADDAEHLRYEYDLKPEDAVFDVGSYRGEWSAEIYRRYNCRMIGIEPTPYNDFQHFEAFINKAASDGEGVMNFGGAYYYTSAHEVPNHSYPCFDLNLLLAKYPEIALLKMNVEGLEYELLPHMMRAGLHERIKDIQVQFHEVELMECKAWYNSIAEGLSETHNLTWRYEFCWENWRCKDA